MALSKKTSVTVAAAVVVLGVAAYFFWMRTPAEPNVTISDAGAASVAQATFLTLASRLEPVAFDASILADERFLSLVDIKTAILPEDAGRNDPFAPLPGVAAE